MSSQKITEVGTWVSKFKGRMRTGTSAPTDSVTSVKAGDMYFDTGTDAYTWYIYDGSNWYGLIGTSTSTSSSTSTTTSTTTTA